MKDLITRKKKAIKTTDMKYLYVPQYESLSVQKILDFARTYPEIFEYLPDAKDVPALPR